MDQKINFYFCPTLVLWFACMKFISEFSTSLIFLLTVLSEFFLSLTLRITNDLMDIFKQLMSDTYNKIKDLIIYMRSIFNSDLLVRQDRVD